MDGRVTSPPLISPSISTRSDGWTPQARNPVSVRLYKVLGTSYDDEGTKQALRTLSDFYAVPPATNPDAPAQRNDDDDDDWEDEEPTKPDDGVVAPRKRASAASESAPAPTAIVGEIAARARKNLRTDVERRLAEGSRKFLDAFRDVDQVCVPSATLRVKGALVLTRLTELGRAPSTNRRYAAKVRRGRGPASADERVLRRAARSRG